MIRKGSEERLACWENIRDRYCRWQTFIENQVEYSLQHNTMHTKTHCSCVLLFALAIGNMAGLDDADMEALGAAAAFHDSRRKDEWLDPGHGKRAAEYYRAFCDERNLPFDERAYLVMEFHDSDDRIGIERIREKEVKNGILLYCIFKDADGLDRLRFGLDELDVDMLRTEEARKLVNFATGYHYEN